MADLVTPTSLPLLHPKSIVFIGGGECDVVIRRTRELGFAGKIGPSTPSAKTSAALPASRSVADIDGAPDVFLMALIPLLLALIAASGGLVSAAFFHPVLMFLMNTSGILIQFVVLPLLFFAAILSIVSTLTEHYKVTQLAQLLRNFAIGILGAFMTIFLGVISVQGASSAVADGVTIRTAKFVTGNFIPVIGRMFTDATDTVISASVLLKNTVGLSGVIILLLITTFPAIKILMISFVYKLAASLLQPLGGGPVIKCLDIISKSMIYIFAALAIVSLMFFSSITVIIASGNITLMVR